PYIEVLIEKQQKMRNIVLTTAALFGIFLEVQAQSGAETGAIDGGRVNLRQDTGFVGAGYNETAEERRKRLQGGVMYLRDVEGDVVIYKDNLEANLSKAKMNVFANQIETVSANGGTTYYTTHITDRFSIKYPDEIKPRTFIPAPAANFRQPRFMEVLSDGKAKLLRHYLVQANSPGANAAYGVSADLDAYKLKQEYYIQIEGESPALIYLSKRSLKKLLGSREPAVLDFITSNRLNYTKPENAIQVFDFYNSLQN
ncbi:MAG TPA: hypothetical protein DCR93_29010, partial [Cytophagales bacterium]|nr:hypothetical protein [Cytophagales bacterium]